MFWVHVLGRFLCLISAEVSFLCFGSLVAGELRAALAFLSFSVFCECCCTAIRPAANNVTIAAAAIAIRSSRRGTFMDFMELVGRLSNGGGVARLLTEVLAGGLGVGNKVGVTWRETKSGLFSFGNKRSLKIDRRASLAWLNALLSPCCGRSAWVPARNWGVSASQKLGTRASFG